MAKFKKKPVVIEATQWFKNGDHPKDHKPFLNPTLTAMAKQRYQDYLNSEGSVVRYYQLAPVKDDLTTCEICGKLLNIHGWVNTLEGGHIVCPGDWIITGVAGEYYPCKPNIFAKLYDPV